MGGGALRLEVDVPQVCCGRAVTDDDGVVLVLYFDGGFAKVGGASGITELAYGDEGMVQVGEDMGDGG